MADIEQQARELLAAEYWRAGSIDAANDLRANRMDEGLGWVQGANMALRAIARALRAAQVPTQFAGWQIWDAASEAWESATEQLYWVVKRARPDEAREVFTPVPVTLATVKPPRNRRTRLREDR